jgi:hypothetical protein
VASDGATVSIWLNTRIQAGLLPMISLVAKSRRTSSSRNSFSSASLSRSSSIFR